MTKARSDSLAVAIFAPRGRDAALASELLSRAGMKAVACPTFEDLCHAVEQGIGVALITEEELFPARVAALVEVLGRQPAWSDLPVLVFSPPQNGDRTRAVSPLQAIGNVSFVDRPVQKRSLLAAVRSALRARQRQYESRRAIVARDEFLAMLGHELRNPLAAIRFSTDLIERPGVAAKGAGKHLDTIERQTGHLIRLVDDLLDVSRVTSGKIVLRQERVDFTSLVKRGVDALWTMGDMQGVTLVYASEAATVPVEGDVVRLEQVVANLLVNAIKYTPAGGRVEARVRRDGATAVLTVRDTGVGIAPEHLESIFDLFNQAPSGLDRAMGGLGLGLTLVRALVGMHGGTIDVRSEGIGRGSEFRVRLPLSDAPAPRDAPAPQPVDADAGRGVHLVLVEDNADIRESLKEVLVEAGYRVEGASDGPRGLSCILSERPSVALIDVGLPGFDGYEVARRARAALGRSLGLIAMTGYGRPDDRTRAFEAGFDEHVVKPSNLDELSAAIARALPPREPEAVAPPSGPAPASPP